jgi:ubiquinone/menaquinone biosynthesis C-methylase UbiE
MNTDRIEREKAFHDDRFENQDQRKVVKKYYSVVQSTKKIYRNHILSRCDGKDLLELGCGPLGTTQLWDRHGAQVTGIDISSEGIRQAKINAQEKSLDINYHAMNAEKTEFPDESFDLIVGMGIVHHLDLKNFYTEANRILKPGGVAVFMEPLGHNPIVNLYRFATPKLRTEDEHPLLLKDIALARKYFAHVDVEYYQWLSLAAFPFRRTNYFESVSSKLEGLDQLIFEHIPYLRRLAWVSIILFHKAGTSAETSR